MKPAEENNFRIESRNTVSDLFLERHLPDFRAAAAYIKSVPFGRNSNKDDPTCIFNDGCGTCSTKHALLKRLADENNATNIDLRLGIYKMSGENTPGTGSVLAKYGLEYIPEAHNYLRISGEILDCTFPGSGKLRFADALIEEIGFSAEQINEFKISYHKKALQDWLDANPDVPYDLKEIFEIRESCIRALGQT